MSREAIASRLDVRAYGSRPSTRSGTMKDVARSVGRDQAAHQSHLGRQIRMSETCNGLRLGQTVPDFELTTYDPAKEDFGKFSMKDQIARKRWSILFFYPADFTFV
jgi:hypothetical protein